MNEDDNGRSFFLLAAINALLLGAVFVIGMKQPRAASTWLDCGTTSGEGATGCVDDIGGEARPIVAIDDMTVQLKSGGDDAFLQLSLGLEVDATRSKELVARQTPRLRDAILRSVSDRTPEQLRGSDALMSLKQSLLQQVRRIVPGQRIRAVYITQFAIL
jgi:flagellar FliL protein